MSWSVVALTFGVIALGELPDKTMFANLVLATRGWPGRVWCGAALAFCCHVVLAVTAGAAFGALLPHRVLDGVAAGLFALGALLAWRAGQRDETERSAREATAHRAFATAFVVIFVAEWGDLTQLLTAELALRYRDPVAVALGATVALWAVAALAIVAGQLLARIVRPRALRRLTAATLLALAALAAAAAA